MCSLEPSDNNQSEEDVENECEESGSEESDSESEDQEGDSANDDEETDASSEEDGAVAGPSKENCESSESGSESDMSDVQADRCAICLSRYLGQELGSPNNCDHTYCAECIVEWSRNMNICPVDRIEFGVIYVRSEVGGPIIRKVAVTRREAAEIEDENDVTFCEVCERSDREDRMLLCDGCDSGYHLECLNPPLRTVPFEEWFCPTCSVEDRQNLAEAVEIEDGELNALLDEQPNFNPNLGPRINRTRLIPRTRQSERVRQVIQRRRNTTTTTRKTTKKKGKRKSGTRKRKTKGKRKYKSSWAKSAGSSSSAPVKTKRRRRRRRRRKLKTGRKIKAVRTVSKTPRERIAEQLGMEKIIPKHFLPVVSGTTIIQPRLRSSGGGEYGPTSLQLFGSRNELIAFEDSYDEENVNGDVDVHVNRVQRRVKSSLVRASPFEVPSSSFNQTNFDVLGNILSCQTQLQLPSHQIRIGRDGKLHMSSEKSLINRNDNCNRTKRPSDPVNNGPSSNSTPARTVIASTNSNITTSNNDGQCSVRNTDFSSNSALSSGSNRDDGDNEGGVGNRIPVEFQPYIGKKKKKVDEEKKKIENDDDIDIYSDIDDVDPVVPEVDPAENVTKSGLDELSLIDGDSRISSASNMQADDVGSEIDPGNESAAVDSDDDLVIDESVKTAEDPDEVPRDCANSDAGDLGEEIEGNNFDRESEVNNEGDSEANNDGDSEANNEGDSEANNEGDSEANNEGESEANNEGDSDANNECDSEANNEGDSEANNETDSGANNTNFKESPDSPVDDEGLLQTEDISSEEEPIMDDEEKTEKPINDNENEENDEIEGEKSENESSNENNEEDEAEVDPEVEEDGEEEGVNKESEQNEENEEIDVPSKEENENPEQEEEEEEEEEDEEEMEQAEGEEPEFQPDEDDFELEKDILEEDPPADENAENDEDEVEIIEQVEGGREVIEDDEVIVTEVRNVGKNRVKSDRTVSRRRERRKSGESNNSGHSRRRRSPYHSLNSSSNRRSSSRNRHSRSGRHEGESHDDHSHKSKSGSSSTSKSSRRHQTDDHYRTNEQSSKSGKHHERKNDSERQNEEREHDKSQFQQQQQHDSGDAQNEESGNTSGDKNLNNEISWKKLSQSTKTRNYRDNRTKLEQHHMRLMERQKRERDRQSRSSPTAPPPPPPPPSSQQVMHQTSSHQHTSPTITNSYEKDEKQQRRERKHSEHRHEKDQRSNSSSNRRDSNERRHVEKRKISSNTSSSGGSGRDGSRLKEHRRRDSSNREGHSTRDRNKERRDRKEAKKEKIKRELERIEREEKHRERKRERAAAAAGLLTSPLGNHSPSLLHHHHHPQPPLPPSSPPSNSPINASPPSTIESKEVYASGDKIIINVNFGRCKNKEVRSGKKRHHQQEPASGEDENANGDKEVKSKKRSKYDHYRPKGIQSPPTPPWNPFASTDTMDDNSKDNEGEEENDEDEEDNNGSDLNEEEVNENASESSCEEDGEEEDDKGRGREGEENQSPLDSIDEDLIDLELENISSFPKRDEKSEKNEIKSPIAAGEEGEGEGAEEANSAYDPFEPTKSPSDKNEADNKRISSEVPPPLPPELPPLPPEPAPEDPSTNNTNIAGHANNSKLEFQNAVGTSNIQHTSTGSNMNFPATLNLSLAPPPNTVLPHPPTPISLANIRIPPPNYLSRPPPQLSNFTWPIGAAAAAANMLFRPNFLSHPPPPIHTGTASGANANSNQAAAAAAATQIRTLLHNQAAQLALLSSLRPTLPPQMTLQPPPQFTIPTSLPQNLAAVAAAVASTAPTMNTNTTSGVNGDTGKQQIDTTEVVDMDVESPYSPGDTLDSASNSQNISDSNTHGHAHHSETKKGTFDSLLPATSSQSRKENVPTRFSGGGSKSSKSGSGKSGSSHRSHRNKTDSHRKHIVRFEMTGGAKAAHGGSAMSGNTGATGGKKDDGKKEVVAKMDESQLKILDELPSSAVEMQVKEKFLKKLNRQERVIEEVKLAVKPYYNRREINKDEYKEILRKSVPKICHNKSGEINPVKIKALVEGYVKKFKYQHKKDGKGGGKRS